jgi:hypothetical protein
LNSSVLGSTPTRLLVGALTLVPFCYFLYFAAWMSSLPNSFTTSPDIFDRLFRIHMIATTATMLLIAASLVYLFRTRRVPQAKKALWAVVLVLGNMIALPVFWYVYVRPSTWSEQ